MILNPFIKMIPLAIFQASFKYENLKDLNHQFMCFIILFINRFNMII